MNAWLKIDAKFNDKERKLSINLEQVQYLSIYDGMVLFISPKRKFLQLDLKILQLITKLTKKPWN